MDINNEEYKFLKRCEKALVEVRSLVLEAKRDDADYGEWLGQCVGMPEAIPEALKTLLDDKAQTTPAIDADVLRMSRGDE